MPNFNPGVIDLDGQQRRFRDWLSEYASAGDVAGVRRLLRRTLLQNPALNPDPGTIKVYAERVAGLSGPQADFVAGLFMKLLGDREIAKAVNQRNGNVNLRDAFTVARSLRIASQIESMQVGPRSVILMEVNPDANRDDIAEAANALQGAFGATVIVKPQEVELRRLSVQELTRLRNRLNTVIANIGGGGG